MKLLLSLFTGLMLFTVLVFQAEAKGHGPGKGKGNGHYKNNYKKGKHYCGAYCHGGHHYYRQKVVIVQPAPQPRPLINISL